MGGEIPKSGQTPSTKPLSQSPKGGTAPQAPSKPLRMNDDSFMQSKPTPAQLAALRADIKALDGLPAQPAKGMEAQRAWVAKVLPVLEKAEKAAHALGSAAFFQKLPLLQPEADAAQQKTWAVRSAVTEVEESTGLRKPTPPADPNRPTFGLTKGAAKLAGKEDVRSLVGLVAMPFAFIFDATDAATRGVQRKAYPAEVAKYEARLKVYEAYQAAHP